jgi:hypothetical protein
MECDLIHGDGQVAVGRLAFRLIGGGQIDQ